MTKKNNTTSMVLMRTGQAYGLPWGHTLLVAGGVGLAAAGFISLLTGQLPAPAADFAIFLAKL